MAIREEGGAGLVRGEEGHLQLATLTHVNRYSEEGLYMFQVGYTRAVGIRGNVDLQQ